MVHVIYSRIGLKKSQTQLTDFNKEERPIDWRATCEACDFKDICNGQMWFDLNCHEIKLYGRRLYEKSYTTI